MEDGLERSSPGSFLRIIGMVAPGKQCVAALKKLVFLIMEKRGRGNEACGSCEAGGAEVDGGETGTGQGEAVDHAPTEGDAGDTQPGGREMVVPSLAEDLSRAGQRRLPECPALSPGCDRASKRFWSLREGVLVA